LEHLLRALPLCREVGDRAREATLLNDIGLIYNRLGQRERALDYLLQALNLGRAMGERRGEAVTLNVIGVTLYNLGEHHQALEHLRQALALRQEYGDQRGSASTLNNIGAVHETLGEHPLALSFYQQSLDLRRRLKDRAGVAVCLNNLGVLYLKTKEPGKALEPLNEALTLRHQSGNRSSEAIALHNLAWAFGELGEWQKSRDYYHQALQLRREVEDPLGEARTLAALARLEREIFNRLDQARELIEDALTLSESQRAELARQDRRMSSLSEQQINYEFYQDLLMEMHQREPGRGYDAQAVQVSERARARGLLELLAEWRANIRQEADPSLLERQEQLQSRISAKEQERMQLLSGKPTEDQRQAARKEIDALLAQYQELEAQIRQRSPRYAALTMPPTLSLGEIQQLLDDDTCLLEYALGERRSFLWVITPRALSSFVLPGRAEIDAAARRAYELLSSSHLRDRAVAAQRAAAELSQMILGPAAGQLGKKRLLIVSDGALQYVPFAALSHPHAASGDIAGQYPGHETRPLIVDREIVSLPSASVLAALRRDIAGRPIASRTVAVFADPVYQGNDPRVTSAQAQTSRNGAIPPRDETAPSRTLTRSARETGVADFARLLFSRREADAIVSLAGRERSARMTDFAANRQAVRAAALEQYRIVHFATHGLLNSQHPELSGIVLSLVDERGQPRDGFLQVHEIYNLRLNAELVVLSACRTALGKEVRGEGLVGLARGFMYAGAARVLASLWDVRDEATAELMRRFYERMLKGNLRPTAAWREAQLSMWKEKRWAAPYYWAGFVLQGEWQ
jgi:CHAT domain-containing protein/Tfp pilus assembly protein PilF